MRRHREPLAFKTLTPRKLGVVDRKKCLVPVILGQWFLWWALNRVELPCGHRDVIRNEGCLHHGNVTAPSVLLQNLAMKSQWPEKVTQTLQKDPLE